MSTRRMSADRAAIVAVLCAVAAAGCSSSNDDLESHEAESQTGKLPPEAEVQAVKPPQVQLSQQCVTLKRGVNGAVEDTRIGSAVVQNNPAKNWGSSTSMSVGAVGSGAFETLIRWDMSAVPANIGITSATMKLAVVSSGAMNVDMHVANAEPTPWTEGAVTWNNFYANPAPQYGAAVQTVPTAPATASL